MHKLNTSIWPKMFLFLLDRLPPNKLPFLSSRPTVVSFILALGSIAFVTCWFVYRHEDFAWILLDILGICFCISILRLIRLQNFKVSKLNFIHYLLQCTTGLHLASDQFSWPSVLELVCIAEQNATHFSNFAAQVSKLMCSTFMP